MVLIVQRYIQGKVFHKKGLDFPIAGLSCQYAMPVQDSARVGIDDEHGLAAGIKKYAIRRLFTYAMDLKQPLPQRPDIFGKHVFQLTVIIIPEETKEGLQPLRLDIVISRRADDRRQDRLLYSENPRNGQQPMALERSDSLFDILPCRILRQNSANNNFKW